MRLAPRSLSGRLMLGSAAATLIVLVVVLLFMQQALTRFVTGQIDQRLDDKIVALASQLRVADDGIVSLVGEADGPPFDRRHHRSFWIVVGPRNTLRTKWLSDGDAALPTARDLEETYARPAPPPPGPGGLGDHPRTIEGEGFGGVALHERVARLVIGGIAATIVVAAPAEAIAAPVGEAMTRIGLAVLALGAALGALAFFQVRVGLRPLVRLQAAIAEVGDGRRERLPAEQPLEIVPLVAEMNRLLDRNAANLDKARRHVANLAHGLKTPLATLQLRIDRMGGQAQDDMKALLVRIDLRVRHHLGRARAGALAGPDRARTLVMPRLVDLGDALTRIHADRAVTVSLDGPSGLALACESHDVDEIFGNLFDNAFKFARARVLCTVSREGGLARIAVADDGPGLGEDEIAFVLQPGRRLDEAVPGFGFGLTIARELVELYGGDMRLEAGDPGLVATVTLPVAASTTNERSG